MPTLTLYPNAFVSGTYTNIANPNNPIGKGSAISGNYATIDCTSGRNVETEVFYSFDCSSIPSNATIYSVECKVGCYVNDTSKLISRCLRLIKGTSTVMGNNVSYDDTASEVSLDTGSSWTRSDLDNLKLSIYAYGFDVPSNNIPTIRFYGATLTINYAVEYNISASSAADSNGYSVSDNGFAKVEEGNDYIFSILPQYNLNPNDVLLTLKDNNIDVSNLIVPVLVGNSYRFDYHLYNVQANHNIVVYVNAGYVIELKTDDDPIYSISPATSSIVTPSSSYTLTITPDNFSACVLTFYDNNIDKTSSLVKNNNNQTYTYSLSNINANHVLDVSGTNWFNVTTNLTGDGTILGAGSYSMGNVDITITQTNPNATVTCTDNNTDVTSQLVQSGNSYIYTIPDISNHHDIAATITLPTHTITTSLSGGNGTISSSATVNHGSTHTVVITPTYINGSDVGLTDNNTNVTNSLVRVGSSYQYILNNVTSDHIISATITLHNCSITRSLSGSGTISPSAGTTDVTYGVSYTFTITPNDSNDGVQLTDNGVDVSSSLVYSSGSYTYTIASVTTNHTLAASIITYVAPTVKYPWFIKRHEADGSGEVDWREVEQTHIPHVKINGNWNQAQAVYYKNHGNWLLVWGTPRPSYLLFAADFTSNLSYTNYIDNSTGNFSYTGTPSYTNSMLNIQQGGQNTFRMSFTIPSNLKTWLQDSTKDHWFTAKWYLTNWTGNAGQYRDTFNSGFGSNSNNIYSRDENMFNIFEFNGLFYKDTSDQTGAPYVPAGTTFWIKANLSHEGYYYQYFYASPSWNNSSVGNNNPTANTWYQSSTKTTEIYNINKALWNNNNNPVNLGFASNGGQTSSTARISNFKIWSQEPSDSEIGI